MTNREKLLEEHLDKVLKLLYQFAPNDIQEWATVKDALAVLKEAADEKTHHIKEIVSEDTGGGMVMDFVVLKTGKVVGLGVDDSVEIYENEEEAGI
jgi:hypothetical protein